MMSRSLGIPLMLLHGSSGRVVSVELKTGEVYRGVMIDSENNWNCLLESVVYTARVSPRDGKVSQLEHAFIRGSKTHAAGQSGFAPGRGVVPPARSYYSSSGPRQTCIDNCGSQFMNFPPLLNL